MFVNIRTALSILNPALPGALQIGSWENLQKPLKNSYGRIFNRVRFLESL